MIKLENGFFITTDSNNWTLNLELEKEVDANGEKKITQKNHWYYPSLQLCLKKYIQESLKNNNSIQEVLNAIDNLYKEIETIKTKKQ